MSNNSQKYDSSQLESHENESGIYSNSNNFSAKERCYSSDTTMISMDEEDESDKTILTKINISRIKKHKSDVAFCQVVASTKGGVFVKRLRCQSLFVFCCGLSHRFILSKKQLSVGAWCNICDRTFENISKYIASMGGRLFSPSLEKNIQVTCDKGHTWQVNYLKVKLRWCTECVQFSKKILKEIIANENKKIEENKKNHQVDL